MQSILKIRTPWMFASSALLTSASILSFTDADAACLTTGSVTTCDTTAPTPWTTRVGDGNLPSGDNRTVEVVAGSTISTGNDTGISLRDGADIAIGNGAIVTNAATTTNGQFNTGGNTIEIRNNGTITIEQGGEIRATGTQAQAEAIDLQGTGNIILNSGTIAAGQAAAIMSQNTNGLNTIVNAATGIIEAGNGTTSLAIGGTGNGALDFTNRGVVRGSISLAAGNDIVRIFAGSIVTGNVQQGGGIDDFQMTGGQIQSLNQGDGLDTFLMSEGRIVDYFDDGDNAKMTGGRIGRVNMKLDDNVFDMSGGTIDKNLVTGFGNDTIILSDGTIGGNISVSGGTDSVTVTGGTVGGEVRMSAGSDSFVWDGGGIIYGLIDLGGDNDTAVLRNLTDANIGATPQITGGTGTDSLSFDNVKTGSVARFDSWESIALGNDSQLVFDGTLTLGDSGTGTGILSVDATSTLYGGGANGGIAPFAAGQLATVVNAGRIDLTNGGGGTADSFTVRGNYSGNNGQLFFNSVLGADNAPSDKLVIDGGTASGTTGMNIINASGSGGTTVQNGILVVEGLNGASTGSDTFALNGRVAAGAYEYFLFKGGVSAGTGENWYLRSAIVNVPAAPTPAPAPSPLQPPVATPQPEPVEVIAPPPPSTLPDVPLPTDGGPGAEPVDPTPPISENAPAPVAPPEPVAAKPADPPPPAPVVATEAAPVPGPATTPPTPGATPVVADVVPLYRPEVAAYAVAPPVAHELAMTMLGTFHDRRGEQSLLRGDGGVLPASWGRILAQDTQRKWGGTVDPSIDGDLKGFQIGQDLWGRGGDGGSTDRIGVFFGYAEMDGRVKGQALGWNDLTVGRINADSTSGGGYWTHVGPSGWYLDSVVMMTWFGGRSRASSGESIELDGTGVTASIEGGYPFALSDDWTLEAQGQIVWNRLSLDDQADRFSSISFDRSDNGTARLGLRLEGKVATGAGLFQPNLKANIWREFSGQQTLRFGSDPIIADLGGTTLEVGGGFTVNLTPGIGLFAAANYKGNLGGQRTRIFGGNAGLSVKW